MLLHNGSIFDFIPQADVMGHGCNCFCTLGNAAGIAREFERWFGVSQLPMEEWDWRGHYNKLGAIDYGAWDKNSRQMGMPYKKYADSVVFEDIPDQLIVVNAYTQYQPGKDAKLWALESCIWKMCQKFPGKEIYIPMIGSGIGGLDPDETLKIFEQYPINVVQYV